MIQKHGVLYRFFNFVNKHASPKLKIVPVSPKEPTQKGKRVKRPAKRPLLPQQLLKKTLSKSKQETHKLQASGSSEGANFESEVSDEQTGKTKDTSEGAGVKPGVPNVLKEDSSDSDNDSWGNGEDESDDVHDEGNNDDDSDSEQTSIDDDENPSFTLKDYKEEEQDEEYVYTLEKDKSDNEEKLDTNMTNAKQGGQDQQNASYESGFVHEEDAHVTLTTVHDKTEGPLKSSSVSSDFTIKLLNIDDPSLDINSLMDTLIVPPPPLPVNPSPHLTTNSTMKAIIKEQLKAQVSKIMAQIEKYVTKSLGAEVLVRSTNQPQTSYAVTASLSEFELKKILIDKMEINESIERSDIQRNLYNTLVESYKTDEEILSSYGDVVTLKRGQDDQDKDKDPQLDQTEG
nr:hypothetical protein [Tanacetum cinerariifolium]